MDSKKLNIKSYNEPYHTWLKEYWHCIPKVFRSGLKNKILKINNIRYDNVFSIGADCTTAQMLKAVSLRKFSAPFDWVSGVDLLGRLTFMEEDYKGFLNKQDLEIRNKVSDIPLKTFETENIKTHMFFPRDFASLNKEDVFLGVLSKYERRINRLNAKLNGKQNLMVYANEYSDDFCFDKISEKIKILAKKYNAKTLDLIYLTLESSSRASGSRVYSVSQNTKIFYIVLPREATGTQKWWHDNVYLHMEMSRWMNTICS